LHNPFVLKRSFEFPHQKNFWFSKQLCSFHSTADYFLTFFTFHIFFSSNKFLKAFNKNTRKSIIQLSNECGFCQNFPRFNVVSFDGVKTKNAWKKSLFYCMLKKALKTSKVD
jgi:hypothetical protein